MPSTDENGGWVESLRPTTPRMVGLEDSTHPTFSRVCLLAWCVLLLGCGQVRLIRDAPDGGVLAIPNNSNQWPSYYRNRAENLMNRKCPEGYVIVKEAEAIDNPATRDGRKPHEHFEYDGAYIRLTTFERKEYRIAFRSAAAAKSVPQPV